MAFGHVITAVEGYRWITMPLEHTFGQPGNPVVIPRVGQIQKTIGLRSLDSLPTAANNSEGE